MEVARARLCVTAHPPCGMVVRMPVPDSHGALAKAQFHHLTFRRTQTCIQFAPLFAQE